MLPLDHFESYAKAVKDGHRKIVRCSAITILCKTGTMPTATNLPHSPGFQPAEQKRTRPGPSLRVCHRSCGLIAAAALRGGQPAAPSARLLAVDRKASAEFAEPPQKPRW